MTEPALYRLSLALADAAHARLLGEWLGRGEIDGEAAVATSLFEEDCGRRWRVDAYFNGPPSPRAVIGALAGIECLEPPRIELVPDENWVAVSQAALPPVEAGRFIVHGSHDRVRFGRRLWAIEIDAGEAFGTAHHASTEGCLMALDRLLRSRRFRRVLDLGCGSGVLAIAAARSWPQARVVASDIDPIAVGVAHANAIRNRCGRSLHTVVATGLGHARLRRAPAFDLVVANILAGPLVRLAPALRRRITAHGALVLAGILASQAREVSAVYATAGFGLERRDLVNGWATLTLVRNPDR